MNAHDRFDARRILAVAAVVSLLAGSCARNPAPVEPEMPDPPPGNARVEPVLPPLPPPPDPSPAVPPVPPPLLEEAISTRSLEEINREAPLQPVFFGYDSGEIDAAARAVVEANAEVLARNPTWVVAIEGHCDSRGTPEYNLALGERRAYAVRDYLVGLGISPDRVQTISYGEEFPFVPGETDEAWAANRRAHFVITGQ